MPSKEGLCKSHLFKNTAEAALPEKVQNTRFHIHSSKLHSAVTCNRNLIK